MEITFEDYEKILRGLHQNYKTVQFTKNSAIERLFFLHQEQLYVIETNTMFDYSEWGAMWAQAARIVEHETHGVTPKTVGSVDGF